MFLRTIIIISFLISLILNTAKGQERKHETDSSWEIQDRISIDSINGINIRNSDTIYFDRSVKRYAESLMNKTGPLYPSIYFTNKKGTEYLKLWGGSDSGPHHGFGWFYAIGFVEDNCKRCGKFIGKTDQSNFFVDHNIKLGNRRQDVWQKMSMFMFRKFTLNKIDYYYYEKGNDPSSPYEIIYFKFKDEKLIEIGFGINKYGINPMLNSASSM